MTRRPYGGITLYARPFQAVPVPRHVPLAAPTTPRPPQRARFGLRPLRSPLLGPSMFSFSSCGYLDVSVPRVRPLMMSVTGLLPAGLPHSDTHGSIPACGSPCIFAACRVLPRLRKPRHPPSALVRFSQVNLQHPVSGMPCFSSACEIVPPPACGLSAPADSDSLFLTSLSFPLLSMNSTVSVPLSSTCKLSGTSKTDV